MCVLLNFLHCIDVFRAMSKAIKRVKAGMHDPLKAHNRIREFYSWQQVAERTERVYDFTNEREESDLWTRIVR
jgi:phosphatidylinositol glycan class A protein